MLHKSFEKNHNFITCYIMTDAVALIT